VNGKEQPSYNFLMAVSEYTNVSLDWLITGQGLKYKNMVWREPTQAYPLNQFTYVPKISVSLNAGGGYEVIEETEERRYCFRADWLNAIVSTSTAAVLLDVKGDSMEPTVMNGDIVLVDRGRTDPAHGHIYALRVGNIVMVKRLQLIREGRLLVMSDNKLYDGFELDLIVENAEIVGQIVWLSRELVKPSHILTQGAD
jgi:phage repressor protein C with HTH and peptisase S24 domain